MKSILYILLAIVLSWLAIHALAVFGVFIAFGYFIWCLLSKNQTFCVACHIKKEGDWCPFCHRKVEKKGVFPKNISSAVFNATVIIILSIISIGGVYVEGQLLYDNKLPLVVKTAYFKIPDKNRYRLGEIFSMKIEIDGIKTPINVVQADISFDPKYLELIDLSTTDSFAKIFIQKEINNEKGYARLTGGVPNPGYNQPSGVFGTLLFKTINPGIVQVQYLPTSMVLANDGKGSDILKSLSPVSYLILPERISPEEESIQTKKVVSSVLGVSNEGAQMKFYDENEVLYPRIDSNFEIIKPNLFGKFIKLLKDVDYFILTWWVRIFNLT